mgnify:CR=1 FL=1
MIAALEGGSAALAVASGAAAIDYAIQALAGAGEHIVARRPFMAAASTCWLILCLITALKPPL